jgi:hypothetical protein
VIEMAENNLSEERIRILKLLEEGKISSEEAIGLLNALVGTVKATQPTAATPPAPPTPTASKTAEAVKAGEPVSSNNADSAVTPTSGKFRFFRVRVTDTRTGRAKALVTIPIGLMEWGLKIGAQFSPEVSNINIADFNQLMESGIDGKLVDVLDEEDGEHVEVFVE